MSWAPPQWAPPEWIPLSGPLAAEHIGAGGRRVVLLHGFTQTARSWRPISATLFRQGFECVAVDLPGHGDSGMVRADLRRAADMVATIGGEAVYVGYSMGGRLALHLGLMYPHLVQKLVVIGTSPGIDDDDERNDRRTADEALAARVEQVGVPAFVDEWLAQPLFAGATFDAAERADRARNTAEGLATSLRMAGTAAQLSLWPRLRELAMPVLYMAGQLDHKFMAIGEQFVRLAPQARLETIPGCGHSVPYQAPELVAEAVVRFVRETRR